MEIERIEQFNARLKGLQQQAAQLQSSVNFHKARLEETCGQLTKMLGIEVTPENLNKVYEDYMKKVENTVNTGEEIMRRIDSQEAMGSGGQTQGIAEFAAPNTAPATPAAPVSPVVSGIGQADFSAPGHPVAPADSAVGLGPAVGFESNPQPVDEPSYESFDEPVPVQVPMGIPPMPPGGHVWGSPDGQGVRTAPQNPVEI